MCFFFRSCFVRGFFGCHCDIRLFHLFLQIYRLRWSCPSYNTEVGFRKTLQGYGQGRTTSLFLETFLAAHADDLHFDHPPRLARYDLRRGGAGVDLSQMPSSGFARLVAILGNVPTVRKKLPRQRRRWNWRFERFLLQFVFVLIKLWQYFCEKEHHIDTVVRCTFSQLGLIGSHIFRQTGRSLRQRYS